MPQDKTRALFERAIDPGATEDEAKTSILQWLRRVREDGEPLVYFSRAEIEERAGAQPGAKGAGKIDPVDALNKIGAACNAFADLLGVASPQPQPPARGRAR
jgi:hypothetical protein